MQDWGFNVGGIGGLAAGKKNRLDRLSPDQQQSANALPREQVARARAIAWTLYRDNQTAKAIVNGITAKVNGRHGPTLTSLAKLVDGQPHAEFRKRAGELWEAVHRKLDSKATPTKPGKTLADLHDLALRHVILSGDVLWRYRDLSENEQKAMRSPIDLTIQLIHPERLPSTTHDARENVSNGNPVFDGIEVNRELQPVAYWLTNQPPQQYVLGFDTEPQRFPADKIGHAFIEEEIDQLRGITWFAPIINSIRDTGDYQYNELKASALNACFMLAYKKPRGVSSSNSLGLNPPGEDTDRLTDADGNPVSMVQPGMVLNVTGDGDVQELGGKNMSNQAAEAYINHMLRSVATGIAGIKGSLLTGDYRASSFSSERAADNETWPQIEAVQDWWYASFTQPIYERVIVAGVLGGWFDGIVSADEFNADRDRFLQAAWQGPVPRGINPEKDAQASAREIACGVSSPQIEAAKRGRNWRAVLEDMAEYIAAAQELGVPLEMVLATTGAFDAIGADEENEAQPERAGYVDASASGVPPFRINGAGAFHN